MRGRGELLQMRGVGVGWGGSWEGGRPHGGLRGDWGLGAGQAKRERGGGSGGGGVWVGAGQNGGVGVGWRQTNRGTMLGWGEENYGGELWEVDRCILLMGTRTAIHGRPGDCSGSGRVENIGWSSDRVEVVVLKGMGRMSGDMRKGRGGEQERKVQEDWGRGRPDKQCIAWICNAMHSRSA